MHFDSSLIPLVGNSPAMLGVRRLIADYGPAEAPVLVTGETGTGKELVARALHETSPRAGKSFVVVNCAAIASQLFESEVFGSLRGAYTGAVRDRPGLVRSAAGGVLFLDEVGELPLEAQAKVLRFLQDGTYRPVGASREGRVDVRVVAATNRDLLAAVADRAFRADLYYRLHVLHIHLPPLRERRRDIPALVERFLDRLDPAGGSRRPTAEALAQLFAWPWPGNVRELEHTVERTLLRGGPGPILRFDLGSAAERSTHGGASPRRSSELLAQLLIRYQGRLGPTAVELGVSVRTVQRRMKRLGLRLRDFRSPGIL